MPSPPYALVQASVNGGALTSGGITVNPGDVVQLSGVDPGSWTSARWELYAFPEGYPAPALWSTAADGTYYSTAFTPPPFTIPDGVARWGKIAPRLIVNGGIKSGAPLAEMTDASTSFSLRSRTGLRGIHAKETTQFGGWAREYERDQKAIESVIGHTSTTVDTTDATVTVLATLAMPTDVRVYTFTAVVVCVGNTAAASGKFTVELSYSRASGGALTQRNLTITPLYRTNASFAVTVNPVTNGLELRVQGVAATNLRWHLVRASLLELTPFA